HRITAARPRTGSVSESRGRAEDAGAHSAHAEDREAAKELMVRLKPDATDEYDRPGDRQSYRRHSGRAGALGMDEAGHRCARAARARDHLLAGRRAIGEREPAGKAADIELRRAGPRGARPGRHRARGDLRRLVRRADRRRVCGVLPTPRVVARSRIRAAAIVAAGCARLLLPATSMADDAGVLPRVVSLLSRD